MRKKLCWLVTWIIISQFFLLPFFTTPAQGETRIVVTFAVGGAIGGLYFFIRFAFQAAGLYEGEDNEAMALLNYSPGGWQVRYPAILPIREELRPSGMERTYEAVGVELLRIRF